MGIKVTSGPVDRKLFFYWWNFGEYDTISM